jgi:hypothetical protein
MASLTILPTRTLDLPFYRPIELITASPCLLTVGRYLFTTGLLSADLHPNGDPSFLGVRMRLSQYVLSRSQIRKQPSLFPPPKTLSYDESESENFERMYVTIEACRSFKNIYSPNAVNLCAASRARLKTNEANSSSQLPYYLKLFKHTTSKQNKAYLNIKIQCTSTFIENLNSV